MAFSGAPGRAYKSLWGPFGLLLGPSRSKKSLFRDLWSNAEGNRAAQNPRSAPGTPRRTPKERFWSDFGRLGVDFGATLGVHGSILGSILHRLGAPCGSISRRFSEYIHADLHAHKHTHKQTNERTKKPNVDRYIQSFNLRGLTTGRIRNIRTPAGSIRTTRPDHRKDPKPTFIHTCKHANKQTNKQRNKQTIQEANIQTNKQHNK